MNKLLAALIACAAAFAPAPAPRAARPVLKAVNNGRGVAQKLRRSGVRLQAKAEPPRAAVVAARAAIVAARHAEADAYRRAAALVDAPSLQLLSLRCCSLAAADAAAVRRLVGGVGDEGRRHPVHRRAGGLRLLQHGPRGQPHLGESWPGQGRAVFREA